MELFLNNTLTYNLLLATIVALPSGLIQGYAGFGGALIATLFFAILYGPVEGFAIILFIVLFGQGAHFVSASKKANWRKVGPVSHTAAATLSFGILFLVSTDPEIICKGMAVFILFVTGFMMSGWSYSGKHATLSGVFTGAVSGGITGCFGVPGFPLQVMYFHSSLENVELRELTFLQLWRLAYLLLYLV